ncbi:MAG: Uncharacterized protein G01um101417_180 [Parcubacteria group bacterium Gr01-1014_17]|nr:MAG: Uncharacterized protein G01um101417_180 [Parcubacteria group bacterium Gr01-1014_17]
MLYFFYGTDGAKAREKASALVASLQEKRPEASVFKMGVDDWNAAALGELIVGQGLFHPISLVQISGVFEDEEAKEYVLTHLGELADSPNIFVLVEGAVEIATVRVVTKAAAKAQEFKKTKIEGQKFNVFSLADALGERNKKDLWVLYQRALLEGVAPENINGVLFWKVKDMLTAQYQSRSWSTDELKNLSARFVVLYHDSHRGKHEFPIALERLILSL